MAVDRFKEPERYEYLSKLLAQRLEGVVPDPATRPATRLPDPGPDAEPVTICGWCPSLHILKLQRREQDVVIIYWQGKELRILRNGVNLKISHGICIPCRERMASDKRTVLPPHNLAIGEVL